MPNASVGRLLGVVVAVVAAGCGSERQDPGWAIVGKYGGAALQTRSGVFDGVSSDVTKLAFWDRPSVCDVLASAPDKPLPADFHVLSVFICTADASPVGDYTFVASSMGDCPRGTASAFWETASTAVALGGVGTMSITNGVRPSEAAVSPSPQPLAGSLQLDVSASIAFAGSFSVPFCSALVK